MVMMNVINYKNITPSIAALLPPVSTAKCQMVFTFSHIKKSPATTQSNQKFCLCPTNVFSKTTLLTVILQQLLKIEPSNMQTHFTLM